MDNMKYLLLPLILLISACGGGGSSGNISSRTDRDIEEINSRIAALSLIASNLEAVVLSDFATCPASGATADPLIRKICQIAQAATIELQIELQSQMQSYVNQLQDQINSANNDLADLLNSIDQIEADIASNAGDIADLQSDLASAQASISSLNASLLVVQADIASLDARMTSAEAAIDALEDLLDSINDTLAGTMESIAIGEENISAGPMYESVLARHDRQRFTGYVEAYTSAEALGNNAITATSGSPTVTISLTAHGFSLGDIIELRDAVSGRGFTTGDLVRQHVITSVPNANSFQVVLPRNASQNGTLGGSTMSVRKLLGRGMATLWKSDDASDSAVRQTTAGSKIYNFIIRRKASDLTNDSAEICWHKTDRAATFATINAAPEGGNVNVTCE